MFFFVSLLRLNTPTYRVFSSPTIISFRLPKIKICSSEQLKLFQIFKMNSSDFSKMVLLRRNCFLFLIAFSVFNG